MKGKRATNGNSNTGRKEKTKEYTGNRKMKYVEGKVEGPLEDITEEKIKRGLKKMKKGEAPASPPSCALTHEMLLTLLLALLILDCWRPRGQFQKP